MPVSYITYEGRRYTPAFRDALVEARRLLPFATRITQGGFNTSVSASAGTHAGDAVDFSVAGLSREQVAALVTALRRVGIAAWFRTTSVGKWGTRAHGFSSYHVHGVPNGWGSPSSGARAQATAYRNGRDGLAGNGADAGPGHVSIYRTRTWQGYLTSGSASAGNPPAPTTTQEDDDMTPDQSAKLDAVFAAVAERPGIERAGESAARQTVNYPVHRGGKPVALIQEIADTKSATLRLEGQLAGLTTALKSLAVGQGVDLDAVTAAAEKGVRQGLEGATVTIELEG